MSRQKDREAFAAKMAAEGMSFDLIRWLMRASATLTRLAEAECSIEVEHPRHLVIKGNPEGQVTGCGEKIPSPWEPKMRTTYSRALVTCWGCKYDVVEKRVSAKLARTAFVPVFSGDPRGAVLKIKVPSGRTDDWGQTGICVP